MPEQFHKRVQFQTGRPYHHPRVKHISGDHAFDGRESQRNIVPIMAVAGLGRVLRFIYIAVKIEYEGNTVQTNNSKERFCSLK